MTTSEELFIRANRVTPGGVHSPVRAFGAVGGSPRFIESASGARLRDVDGREYLDLIGSWGPMILGHRHPAVVEAVENAVSQGFSYGTASVNELLLAEEIVRRIEPVEKVRFASSGTEATMSAIRLARGVTGRPVVVKFAGHYHGHVDALLAAAGSGAVTFGNPDSAGVTAGTTHDTVVVPYNDEEQLQAAFEKHAGKIAAVITEASSGNMGLVPPNPGFTRLIRKLTRAEGALFISDEVMTGFRVSPTGWFGFEGLGVQYAPDLFTFGKVVGGGFPLAAFGGRGDIMDQLAPHGPVYQAGTLSGNPVATAAGLATLQNADEQVYRGLSQAADRLSESLRTVLTDAGVPHIIQQASSMFSVFFVDPASDYYHQALAPRWGDRPAELYRVSPSSQGKRREGVGAPIQNFQAAQAQHAEAFGAFFLSMLESGVHLPPSGYEVWFLSAAHDESVLEQIEAALKPAAKAAAAALR